MFRTILNFFFQMNQAGELPIILERRNNTQTEHNNDNETDQTMKLTSWIGTSTRPRNSTPTLLNNNRLDWDINADAPLHLTRLETTKNNKKTRKQQPILTKTQCKPRHNIPEVFTF